MGGFHRGDLIKHAHIFTLGQCSVGQTNKNNNNNKKRFELKWGLMVENLQGAPRRRRIRAVSK